ncbi:hypothetical protein ISN44_As05g046390 [Arabidopsis suecica]|uniref:Uncharacterized protein n=1 Tax=Arabidopsis suecica TaxID=45249 RepID=A0A8T2DMD9_ARASU|nr:hypothetical protein ISN44_As05g046390 [Arabidopsis suecica]
MPYKWPKEFNVWFTRGKGLEAQGKEEGVEKVLVEKEKEKEETHVSWEKDGFVSIAYTYVIHHFNLERGLINYSKWTVSAPEKKKDKKKEEEEDDVENDIRKLISLWIKFGSGIKLTAADLRKLANDKQHLKKLLREFEKKNDEFIEKLMKEKKLEKNKRKKEKKGKTTVVVRE